MAGSDEIEARAAEFALGTLDATERAGLIRDMAQDPQLAARVEAWERRLAPLALALEPIVPPAHIRGKLMRMIAGDAGESANVVILKRRLGRWRGATVLVSALAAALTGVLLVAPPRAPEAGRYVAVLQSEGPGPAFLASVDLASGTISVRTVAAEQQTGKSYELWALGAGREKPQSLGVIDVSFRVSAGKLGAIDRDSLDQTVFAVSLEPEGGSPTGQPTGPVLFTGKLVATE